MTSPFLVNRQVLLGGSVNLIFSSTTVSPLAVSFIARYCAMVWPSPSATDSMPLQAVVRFALQRTDIDKDIDITFGDKRVQQYAKMSFQLGDITYPQEHLLVDSLRPSAVLPSAPPTLGPVRRAYPILKRRFSAYHS